MTAIKGRKVVQDMAISSSCGTFTMEVDAVAGSEEAITPWLRAGHVCMVVTAQDGDMMLPRMSADRAEWLAAQLNAAAGKVRKLDQEAP